MNTFISIQDAIEITGKSESTIRRIINEIKNSKDKDLYLTMEEGVTNPRYLVNRDYLFKKLRYDPSKASKKPSGTGAGKEDLLDHLKEEVEYLRKQVLLEKQEKAELIQRLSVAQEALKNQQVLLANEQKKRLGD